MGTSLSKKAERLAYDILFTLEDELEIQTKKLPEVYYFYKNFSFKNIGINIQEYSNFKFPKNKEIGFHFHEEGIIMVNSFRKDILAEEVGHFIHSEFIGSFQEIVNDFGARTIDEMVGYFCSKLIDPKRKVGYKEDNFKDKKLLNEKIDHLAHIISKDAYEDLIHQQGYNLGESLYNHYLSGMTKIEEIRKIIKNPLTGHNVAFIEFLNLRKKFID